MFQFHVADWQRREKGWCHGDCPRVSTSQSQRYRKKRRDSSSERKEEERQTRRQLQEPRPDIGSVSGIRGSSRACTRLSRGCRGFSEGEHVILCSEQRDGKLLPVRRYIGEPLRAASKTKRKIMQASVHNEISPQARLVVLSTLRSRLARGSRGARPLRSRRRGRSRSALSSSALPSTSLSSGKSTVLSGRRRREHRSVLPASLLTLLLEASHERREVGRLARLEDGVLGEAELGDARRRDAKGETSEEAGVVANSADCEDSLNLAFLECGVRFGVEGDGLASLAPL